MTQRCRHGVGIHKAPNAPLRLRIGDQGYNTGTDARFFHGCGSAANFSPLITTRFLPVCEALRGFIEAVTVTGSMSFCCAKESLPPSTRITVPAIILFLIAIKLAAKIGQSPMA